MWPSYGAIVFAVIGGIVFVAVVALAINYFANKGLRKKIDELLGKKP